MLARTGYVIWWAACAIGVACVLGGLAIAVFSDKSDKIVGVVSAFFVAGLVVAIGAALRYILAGPDRSQNP